MGSYKDNQLTFQNAQRATKDVHGSDYGHQLKQLKKEINEAFQQIDSAMVIASEHQRVELEGYQSELQSMYNQIEE